MIGHNFFLKSAFINCTFLLSNKANGASNNETLCANLNKSEDFSVKIRVFFVRSKAIEKLPICFETDVGYLKRNFNSH